jgi:phosphoribosylformylglycinamidine cyclo-ligase
VRKVVALSGLAFEAAAPFDDTRSLGAALLTPTRIYVASCLKAHRETNAVKALAHITGGGFPDNIPRVLPKGLGIELNLGNVPVPGVFRWLAATGGIAEPEMLRTFNCGIGMVAVVPVGRDQEVIDVLAMAGETVVPLGHLVPAADDAPRVTYNGHLDLAW